jgi:hypothetical protein
MTIEQLAQGKILKSSCRGANRERGTQRQKSGMQAKAADVRKSGRATLRQIGGSAFDRCKHAGPGMLGAQLKGLFRLGLQH